MKKNIFLLLLLPVAFSIYAQNGASSVPKNKANTIKVTQSNSNLLTAENIQQQQLIENRSVDLPADLNVTMRLPLPSTFGNTQQRGTITEGPQTACIQRPKSYSVSLPSGTSLGITSTYWNFGDGSPGVSVPTNGTSLEWTVEHVYTTANQYTITVQYKKAGTTLFDTKGLVNAVSCELPTIMEMSVNPNIHFLRN